MKTFEGEPNAEGLRLAIVASRFNDEIVQGLIDGATSCLLRHGAGDEGFEIYRVPGAFEIPAASSRLARSGRFDAVIALGALVRGDTPHFDFISSQTTLHISRVSIDTGIPVAFGVITCDTMEQARARSGPKAGNKGWEAALAAVEMVRLFRKIG